jgi:hypothetical protein
MTMIQRALLGLSAVLLLAGCPEDEKDDEGSTAGTTAMAGAMATAGTGAGTGAAAGTGAGAAASCTAPAGPTMCGTEACTAPGATAAEFLCERTCCTTDNKCGTVNSQKTTCMAAPVNDTMCPNETILGNMAVGCCIEAENRCGVVDTITNSGCRAREEVPFNPLPALNCDGTTPMTTAGTGAAGTGEAGVGDAGVGAAGTMAAGTGG